MSKNSCLSDKGILRCINETKSIFIHPFSLKQLSTSSYDVTLGENYYREQEPDPLKMLYNPYSEKDVSRVWGKPCVAEFAKDLFKESEIPENISPDDQIILIRPNETILAHTVEFIGGRYNVTTMMKARSSMGRNFIEVCKCAGWGMLFCYIFILLQEMLVILIDGQWKLRIIVDITLYHLLLEEELLKSSFLKRKALLKRIILLLENTKQLKIQICLLIHGILLQCCQKCLMTGKSVSRNKKKPQKNGKVFV